MLNFVSFCVVFIKIIQCIQLNYKYYETVKRIQIQIIIVFAKFRTICVMWNDLDDIRVVLLNLFKCRKVILRIYYYYNIKTLFRFSYCVIKFLLVYSFRIEKFREFFVFVGSNSFDLVYRFFQYNFLLFGTQRTSVLDQQGCHFWKKKPNVRFWRISYIIIYKTVYIYRKSFYLLSCFSQTSRKKPSLCRLWGVAAGE